MPQGLTDGLFGIGMLFLTGTDVFLTESTIFEILSKFGVIAVLWYWLRDLKAQLKEQLGEFRDETKEIRTHYDKLMQDRKEDFDKLMNEILKDKGN
jgi:hypothetical protein